MHLQDAIGLNENLNYIKAPGDKFGQLDLPVMLEAKFYLTFQI